MATFNPLANTYSLHDVIAQDTSNLLKLKRLHGLANSDFSHLLYLPPTDLGYNHKSHC